MWSEARRSGGFWEVGRELHVGVGLGAGLRTVRGGLVLISLAGSCVLCIKFCRASSHSCHFHPGQFLPLPTRSLASSVTLCGLDSLPPSSAPPTIPTQEAPCSMYRPLGDQPGKAHCPPCPPAAKLASDQRLGTNRLSRSHFALGV